MFLNKELELVALLRNELFAQKTRSEFRVNRADFSRQPLLTLPRVATLILRGHKVSQQNAVNKLFRELEESPAEQPTGSAYCQAREKLRPELFIHLNNLTASQFEHLSEQDGSLQSWHGRRLLGCDGTRLNMPDNPLTRDAFTLTSNQYEGAGERVQGFAVVLYDLLHDIGLSAELGPLRGESEALMQKQVWEATRPGDVIVLDRGYCSYQLLAWAAEQKRDLLIRCKGQNFKAVDEFKASGKREQIIDLECSTRSETRAFVKKQRLPMSVRVRLLRFELPGGEVEILMTTLCDKREYRARDLYEAYGLRWRHETYYDRVKNIFEVERFSGQSVKKIEQDFYGVLFLATLESAMVQSTQQELDERAEEKGLKLRPKVNRALSYVAMVEHAVDLLVNPEVPLETAVSELHLLFKRNPTRHREGRQQERPKRSLARSLHHQRYSKRIIA
jgi:hypothetical protein